MRSDTMWGGGGEVVGLTNVLQRPIHVYELQSTGRRRVPLFLVAIPVSAHSQGYFNDFGGVHVFNIFVTLC